MSGGQRGPGGELGREQTMQEHVGPSPVHCRAGGQPGKDYGQGSDDTV